MANSVHFASQDFEYNHSAMSFTHFFSGFNIQRQVYLVALPFDDANIEDGRQKTVSRAMVQNVRRHLRAVAQFYIYRMALAGSDLQAIGAKGKTLFVVFLDYFEKGVYGKILAFFGKGIQ